MNFIFRNEGLQEIVKFDFFFVGCVPLDEKDSECGLIKYSVDKAQSDELFRWFNVFEDDRNHICSKSTKLYDPTTK